MPTKVYKPGEIVPASEPFAYVTGHTGHFLVKRNKLFEACVRVECIPGQPEQREFFRLKTGKIPMALFRQVLAFLEKVYEAHRSEGIVLLTHENGQWGIHVPDQEVGAAHLKYENKEKARVVGSIHSHPGFTSTPSGTDEHDELDFDGIHVVTAGFLPIADCITAFGVVNGRRFRIPVEDLIEDLAPVEATFPEEWLKRVKIRKSEPRMPVDSGLWTQESQAYVPGSDLFDDDALDEDLEDEEEPEPGWEREDVLRIERRCRE